MINRRTLLAGGGATVLIAAARVPNDAMISPKFAFRDAQAGRLLVVDIRTPAEWCATGIGKYAYPLDMRSAQFTQNLLMLAKGNKAQTIALICASGGRSGALAKKLRKALFLNVLDVEGGMKGNWLHKGWIGSGLPLRTFCASS